MILLKKAYFLTIFTTLLLSCHFSGTSNKERSHIIWRPFGENNYFDVGNSNSWKFGTGDFSIEFWMKANVWEHDPTPNSTQALEYMTVMGNGIFTPVTSGSLGNAWDGLQFVRVGTYWANYLGIPESGIMMMLGDGTNYNAVGTFTALSPGKWYHVVGERKNGVASIYLNGVLQQTKSIPYNVTVNRSLFIGRQYDPNYPRYFNGIIDEASFYNYALSGTDILNIYNAEKCKTLWW